MAQLCPGQGTSRRCTPGLCTPGCLEHKRTFPPRGHLARPPAPMGKKPSCSVGQIRQQHPSARLPPRITEAWGRGARTAQAQISRCHTHSGSGAAQCAVGRAALRLEGRPPNPTAPTRDARAPRPPQISEVRPPPASPTSRHASPANWSGIISGSRTNFGGGRGHPRAPSGPPPPGPECKCPAPRPMAGRAGPALPRLSQWTRGARGASRPPPRSPGRARPARSFLHVGLGRGAPAGRGLRAPGPGRAQGGVPAGRDRGVPACAMRCDGPGAHAERDAVGRTGPSARDDLSPWAAVALPWSRPPSALAAGARSPGHDLGGAWTSRTLRPGSARTARAAPCEPGETSRAGRGVR